MSQIAERFASLGPGEKALVVFVTGGDPSIADLPALLALLAEAGADIIEVGVPFSDPIADGPVIQASSQRALDGGTTPTMVLNAVSEFTRVHSQVPVVLMGYYNTVLRRGLNVFAREAQGAGVSGVILSDLTPEESEPWLEAAKEQGLDTIFLVAPTSTEERMTAAAQHSGGFLYAVSRTGVTGAGQELATGIEGLVKRAKSKVNLPVCVGFGISTPEHVRDVCQFADGAVVGSQLVRLIAEQWQMPGGPDVIADFVRGLKLATRPS